MYMVDLPTKLGSLRVKMKVNYPQQIECLGKEHDVKYMATRDLCPRDDWAGTKLLVGPTFVKSHDQLKGACRE